MLNKNIIHEIGNYLNQIVGNAEYLINSGELSEYGEKIKRAAYSIDALISDATIEKPNININKNSVDMVDFEIFSTLNVMIVDDLIENIHILENIFNTLSCKIISAQSGEEAIELYKNGFTPDIVCMDMVMPGIDGSTTTKELKLLDCKAYFIAISALKNQPNNVVSLFDCWLPKPFTLEHITSALSGYKTSNTKELCVETYKLGLEISSKEKDELLRLANCGAYSELERLISKLQDSASKEFLSSALKRVDFNLIIKSIVPS